MVCNSWFTASESSIGLLIPMRHKLFRVFSAHHHFAAYIYHEIADAFLFQQLRNDIYCIAFGYGAARKHDAGILFDNFSVGG